MAGERSYFSNECCKKPPHVQTHMDNMNRRSAFSRERTMQSPWKFHYFCCEEQALCWHPLTALNTPPEIIQEPEFIAVQSLWPLALKRDPASKWHGSYLQQYGTSLYNDNTTIRVCQNHQFHVLKGKKKLKTVKYMAINSQAYLNHAYMFEFTIFYEGWLIGVVYQCVAFDCGQKKFWVDI